MSESEIDREIDETARRAVGAAEANELGEKCAAFHKALLRCGVDSGEALLLTNTWLTRQFPGCPG